MAGIHQQWWGREGYFSSPTPDGQKKAWSVRLVLLGGMWTENVACFLTQISVFLSWSVGAARTELDRLRWLMNSEKFICQQFSGRGPRAWMASGEGPLLGYRWPASCCVPSLSGRRVKNLWALFYQTINPTDEGSTLLT